VTLDEFNSQVTRLRNHYGDRQYTTELVALLIAAYGKMHVGDFKRIVDEAIATRPVSRPPLRDDFAQIADALGLEAVRRDSWKYVRVDDCLRCNGCGFFFIKCMDGRIAPRCCNDCFAGRNLQQAPKGTVKEWKIPPGWSYFEPGEHYRHEELHPELLRRFGSWKGLEDAIRERRMSQTGVLSDYIKSKGGGVKSVQEILK